MADKALRNAYNLFSIEHVLNPRHNPPGSTTPSITTQLQGPLGNAFNPAMMHSVPLQSSNSQMPLLGFIHIVTVEVLSDPSRAWGDLSRVLRMYQLESFRGWGDMPRSILPEGTDQRMLQRVRDISNLRRQGESSNWRLRWLGWSWNVKNGRMPLVLSAINGTGGYIGNLGFGDA